MSISIKQSLTAVANQKAANFFESNKDATGIKRFSIKVIKPVTFIAISVLGSIEVAVRRVLQLIVSALQCIAPKLTNPFKKQADLTCEAVKAAAGNICCNDEKEAVNEEKSPETKVNIEQKNSLGQKAKKLVSVPFNGIKNVVSNNPKKSIAFVALSALGIGFVVYRNGSDLVSYVKSFFTPDPSPSLMKKSDPSLESYFEKVQNEMIKEITCENSISGKFKAIQDSYAI